MNAKDLRRAAERAKQQVKSISLDVPPRQPDESPITQSQIRYIRSMVKSVDEAELSKLGRRQAAQVIEDLKLERDLFTDELIEEHLTVKTDGKSSQTPPAQPKPENSDNPFVTLIILAGIAFAFYWIIMGLAHWLAS